MKLTIPKPPSVNNLYGLHGHIKYMTKRGKEWFETAGWTIREQTTIGKPLARCKIGVIAHIMDQSDLDNLLKATQDLLTHMGIIEDDKYIMDIHMQKVIVKHRKEEKLEVEIEKYETKS